VLHLRASNDVGGPERQILRYCAAPPEESALPRQILATFTRPGKGGAEGEGYSWLRAARAAGISAWALPGGGWRDARALAALDRLTREQGVALICAHGYRADLLGGLVGRRRGIPVAWFLRGWTGENRAVGAYEFLDRALLGTADRVVCLSRTQAAALPARIPRSRVSVVVNAIATAAGEPDAARRNLLRHFAIAGDGRGGPFLVAIAGRLSPEKGASVFLQAATLVRRQRPAAHFLVFGDGPLRAALEAQRLELGLAGRLHFAGHVADWTRLLPGVDVLVNPSWSEQSPNVVLEAMAARVAVIATAVGGVSEMAGVGELPAPCLELVAAGAVAPLASAIGGLLDDSERRLGLAEAGWRRVRDAYSPERQRRQLGDLYDSIDGRGPRRGCAARPACARPGMGTPEPHAGAALQGDAASTQRARPPAEVSPLISIVLPVRNEAAHLGTLLQQLLEQDYPRDRFEILIADGGCLDAGDGTTELAREEARRSGGRVRWLANTGRTSSAGRNCGLAAAAGEWIIFVDGHCRLPGTHWLRDTVRTARATGALCLSRPQPLRAERGQVWQQVIAAARSARIGHGADSTIFDPGARGWVHPASSGAVYHRSLFERVGHYDESFDACEDVEFNQRLAQAGLRAWLCPEAVVYYAARSTPRRLWRQMKRYGRGRVRLARKHAAARSAAQCLPALWLAWLPLALATAVLARGAWRAVSLASLAAYAAVVGGYAIAAGRRHGWRHLLAAPVVFFLIHAGLGAGTWLELVSWRGRAPGKPKPVPRTNPDSFSGSNL